jgi:hypothetical protein
VKGSATVGGPNGHQSNSSEIEGQPDPRLETRVPDGGARRGPDGVPDEGQTGCLTGPDGVPNGAGRDARRGPDGVPDG